MFGRTGHQGRADPSGFRSASTSSFFFVFALLVFLIATQVLPDSLDGLGGAERWLYGVVAGIIYFVSLLIHELAHSLMAKRYGMEVSSITLFFFGGVSLIREDSQRPGQEFWIAIVGPLASLILGAGFLLIAYFALPSDSTLQRVVFALGVLNGFLAAFNMLPGFPLDGGSSDAFADLALEPDRDTEPREHPRGWDNCSAQ